MTDLYQDLGCPPDASPEELQAAHRRRTFQTHPDRGGSREEFDRVQRAWLILKDPERRRRYDATGDAQEVKPDNSAAELAGILAHELEMAVKGLLKAGRKPRHADLVKEMKESLERRGGELRMKKRRCEEALETLQEVGERLEDGEGLLTGLVQHDAQEARTALKGLEHDLEVNQRALDYLTRCKYRFEPGGPTGGSPSGFIFKTITF